MKTMLTLITVLFTQNLWANVHTATVVHASGEVIVLNTSGSAPFVLYQNKKYAYRPAKIGSKVIAGEIIQTKGNSKAKLIFSNGDSLNVGAGSSIMMPKPLNKTKDKETELNVIYGKIRAIISKESPRNNLKIKTNTAVAGVRGTDVYLHHNLQTGTRVSVIRGQVEVVSKTESLKPVVVKTGYMTTSLVKQIKELKSIPLTKEKLIEVQVQSTVEDKKEVTKGIKKSLNTLEEKNKQVILADIKSYQPEVYKEFEKQKQKLTSDEMSAKVVSRIYKTAPSENPKYKPSKDELNSIGDDVYKKYFNQ